MAQTSVEWLEERLSVSLGDEIKYLRGFFVIAKEKHKVDCISFSDEWEIRRDEEDIKDKEDLYNSIYNQ